MIYGQDWFKRAPRSKQVFDFVRAEMVAGRQCPSYRAIAEHMGWKRERSARDCLNGLALYGFLERRWEGHQTFFSLPNS